MTTNHELLTRKELADKLKHSRQYIWRMEKRGFKVIGGRATLESALSWLASNPCPCSLHNLTSRNNS